jgi:hypothetical protein
MVRNSSLPHRPPLSAADGRRHCAPGSAVIGRYWSVLGFAVWLGGILAYVFLPWLRADPLLFMLWWGLALFYLGMQAGKHERW